MQHSFTPEPVVCRDLFDGEEDLYQIPRYQRPYSWEESHIEQLVEDLYESWSEDRDSPYYLGSVILVKEDGDDRFDILDGQQRLTTLTIFYAIFNDHFKEYLSDKNKRRVRGRVKERALEKPRLRTNKQVDLEESVLETLQLDQDNRYTKAAGILIDELEDKFDDQTENLNDFFEFVDQQIELISITSDDLTHAVRLFQTINTRGKDLTVSDLTKSYLLSNLEDKEDKDDVIEVWQEITTKVDDDYDTLDDILGMYRLYLRQQKAKQTTYEELKSEFEGDNPKSIVVDIRDFVTSYKEIENSSSQDIFILENLKHELYWKTILIAAKKKDIEYIDKLRDELIGFYYSYWMGDYTSEKIKIPSIKILSKLRDGDSFEEIQKYMEDKRQRDNIPERVRDGLHSENVYGNESWHKSLLIAVEYNRSTSQTLERISKSGGGLHIEHVLPKKYEKAMDRYDYWENHFTKEEASRLKNTLGNLVPLQYDLNSSAAQKPFPDKAEIYRGESDKPRSSFSTTLRIAEETPYTDWTPEAIQENKEFLIGKAAEILNLPEGSIKQEDEEDLIEA
ncbi:DUF262 domain-containing protein [Halosimplex salinum]|uniref:DUF262 domain-containing protein n=1 Tax=Halosimplex salinum TaxID=1710538 RepID=UPI000F4A0484|nr:DUF262 domain-containing protein [Halosimplex salinum]